MWLTELLRFHVVCGARTWRLVDIGLDLSAEEVAPVRTIAIAPGRFRRMLVRPWSVVREVDLGHRRLVVEEADLPATTELGGPVGRRRRVPGRRRDAGWLICSGSASRRAAAARPKPRRFPPAGHLAGKELAKSSRRGRLAGLERPGRPVATSVHDHDGRQALPGCDLRASAVAAPPAARPLMRGKCAK